MTRWNAVPIWAMQKLCEGHGINSATDRTDSRTPGLVSSQILSPLRVGTAMDVVSGKRYLYHDSVTHRGERLLVRDHEGN